MKRPFVLFGLLSSILFLESSFTPYNPKIRHVYLTWQHDPCKTITVNLHGIKTPSELTVYYDTCPHFSKVSAYRFKRAARGRDSSLPDKRRIYSIELNDLLPNTTYFFTVGDTQRSYGNELHFKTISDDENASFLFIEGGDWENTPSSEWLAKKAASLNPTAILLGGDYPSNVYGTNDYDKWDYWLDVYTSNMKTQENNLIPLVLAIGNHEVIGGFSQPREQVPFFFDYFCQGDTGKSFFSLPFGKNIRVFVLDSGHTEIHEGPQLAWLREELESYQDVPVKIALYHVPIYPSVRFSEKDMAYRSFYNFVKVWKSKQMAGRLFSKESYKGKKYWLPLFDRFHLTVAFEHHDQSLKRTKLLKKGRPHPYGTLYLGDGGWGAEIQYPPIQGLFHNHFAALLGKVHFFWVMEIERNRIIYSAISDSGKVLDKYIQTISY